MQQAVENTPTFKVIQWTGSNQPEFDEFVDWIASTYGFTYSYTTTDGSNRITIPGSPIDNLVVGGWAVAGPRWPGFMYFSLNKYTEAEFAGRFSLTAPA